ncbi:MAG: hypothetical protein E7326_01070 [Clostridiales bacterium]|nr:hypothetical protein [Clostridiales bacterium]
MSVILLNGAPGSGKSTVSALLHERLRCPWFEFGWIPEFRHLNPHTEISYEEEEALSFENLMLVAQNYLRHGFEHVLISDLRAEFVHRAAAVLEPFHPQIITLYAAEETLRHRVLTRQNGNEYRNADEAALINARILSAPASPCETRIDTTHCTPEEVCDTILSLLA